MPAAGYIWLIYLRKVRVDEILKVAVASHRKGHMFLSIHSLKDFTLHKGTTRFSTIRVLEKECEASVGMTTTTATLRRTSTQYHQSIFYERLQSVIASPIVWVCIGFAQPHGEQAGMLWGAQVTVICGSLANHHQQQSSRLHFSRMVSDSSPPPEENAQIHDWRTKRWLARNHRQIDLMLARAAICINRPRSTPRRAPRPIMRNVCQCSTEIPTSQISPPCCSRKCMPLVIPLAST
jgi:hypothetical protein